MFSCNGTGSKESLSGLRSCADSLSETVCTYRREEFMIKELTICGRKNPIGLDEIPSFSWKLSGAVMQTAYQIQITESVSGKLVWDTGRVESVQSLYIRYEGKMPEPMTEYSVSVQVWDSNGSVQTASGTFETGIRSDTMPNAMWITHTFPAAETAPPVFSKEIFLEDKPIHSVRLYLSACGIYEAAINGVKAGDAFFAPGWTSYHSRIQYQTLDATSLVTHEKDKILLEVTVANGWFAGYLNGGGENHFYGDRTALIGLIRIQYEDGSVQEEGTDETWMVRTGPIRSAEIYHGEIQDFTVTERQTTRSHAVPADQTKIGKLTSQESEPVRITDRLTPKDAFYTPEGDLVVDFGQNLAGFVEVTLPAWKSGTETNHITLRHAETLDRNGNFYTENLRTARAADEYIYGPDMVGEKVHPHFTYHGFRYAAVTGMTKEQAVTGLTSCALHTDMERTGKFVCSNEKVNRLYQNILWGQNSNYFDIPTDCPQRDERLGWTGDAQIFAETASYNYNTAHFFQKWLRDVALESDEEHGVPHLVPNIVGPNVGCAVWGDCATVIPWQMYETYGDKEALRESYPLMKLWVDYIYRQSGDSVLWLNGFQRGDWLALDAPASCPGQLSGGTDKNLVANAYYAWSVRMVRDASEVLGYEKEREIYAERYEKIVKALNDEFITKTGRIVTETQTSCALLLYLDLVSEANRDRVIKTLESLLVNQKGHITTGFVGTAFLPGALSKCGRHDLAAQILLQEGYPGWFYCIDQGATTIWERWNSVYPDGTFDESGMNSLNHYSFGSVGSWLYKTVGGIRPLEAGYKKVLIAPYLTKGMTWARTSLETGYGTVISEWKCEEGTITVSVTVPANTTAVLHLPEKNEALELGPGVYEYSYPTNTNLLPGRFSENTVFAEILEDPDASSVLYEFFPGMKDSAMLGFLRSKTIGEMGAMSAESKKRMDVLLEKLNKLYS